MKSILKTVIAGAVLATIAGFASATDISSGSSSFSFSWADDINGDNIGDLTGTGTISATGFGTTVLDLTITLNNTTNLSNYRLTAFGFGITPNASDVTFQDAIDGGMVGATLNTGGNTNIPSLQGIDVCSFGGNNCPGGSNGGIDSNSSDTFHLLLTSINGALWGTTTIDPLGYKYQTPIGSFEFSSTSGTTDTSGKVPEPASSGLALIGLGLLGAGLYARRRHS